MQGSPSLALSLRNALRSSPWFVIALALHGVAIATFSIIYVAQHRTAPAEEVTRIQFRPRAEVAADLPVDPPERFDRTAIPPDTVGELVSTDTFIPLDLAPQDLPEDLHDPVGDPTALPGPPGAPGSTSIGAGPGPGRKGLGVAAFWDRNLGWGNGSTPGRPLREPPVETEAAVRDGLCWLLRHQNDDGSWSAGALGEHCSLDHACAGDAADFSAQYDPGLTSLALLAFLGHGLGETSDLTLVDEAMAHRHFVGQDVGKGLRWLMSELSPDGSFSNYSGSLYNEALGTLALCEAYGLSRNPELKDHAGRALRYLLAAQKSSPTGTGRWGWRYTPGGDSVADTSVTGWAVMALKSAEFAGLAVPREAYEGALSFTRWVTGEDGLVGYLDPVGAGARVTGRGDEFDYHVGTMSALGMLVRTFAAHDIADPFLDLAARQIAKDLPAEGDERLGIDYYYWYYGTLALNQYDGPDSPRADRGRYWKPWNEAMVDQLLQLQDHDTTRNVCSRGGWLVPDRWSHSGGPIYSTAINVLTLEVYYRYPNAFGLKPAPPPAKPR